MKRIIYIFLLALLACGCTDFKQKNKTQEVSESHQPTVTESTVAYDDGNVNQEDNQSFREYDNTPQEDDNSDWHNWDSEDIGGFYVEIDDCDSDDEAKAISERYSNGEYIEEWGRYFMPKRIRSGEYEVELGEKVTNKLFKLKGTDVFIYFKWSTSCSIWDEGVIDVWSNRGTFYKKP